jgi:hypothetical protein
VKGGPIRRSNFNKMSAWPHGGIPVHLGGLVVNDGRMLIRRSAPALVLLAFAVRFAYSPRLSLS